MIGHQMHRSHEMKKVPFLLQVHDDRDMEVEAVTRCPTLKVS